MGHLLEPAPVMGTEYGPFATWQPWLAITFCSSLDAENRGLCGPFALWPSCPPSEGKWRICWQISFKRIVKGSFLDRKQMIPEGNLEQ